MPQLQHIDIEVNHRCNLGCRHCSARAAKGRHVNELTSDQVKHILSGAVPLGLRKVGLTGGEPMYDVPKLEEIARFCLDELGVPIHMHANGTLVEPEHCRGDGVLTLFEAVSITFLGGGAPTHDAMTRTRGAFERTLRGTRHCVDARLPLTCYFIPTRGTCQEFLVLAEELRELGVTTIRAMALAPSGRARAIYDDTAPTRSELTVFEKGLLDVRDRLGMRIEAGYCTRLSMPRLAVLSGHDRCMSGLNRVHINSKGDVFPCTAASGVRELRLGNLVRNGDTIASVWRDAGLVNLIRKMHAGELAECGSCSRATRCRHACTVNACGTMSDEQRKDCPLFSQNGH